MKKYVYLFSRQPGDEERHLECIDHACTMASLYNDVTIIFSKHAVLNLKCNDKRIRAYKTLDIFGIQKFIIDADYANKYDLKVNVSDKIKLLPRAEYDEIITKADVVF